LNIVLYLEKMAENTKMESKKAYDVRQWLKSPLFTPSAASKQTPVSQRLETSSRADVSDSPEEDGADEEDVVEKRNVPVLLVNSSFRVSPAAEVYNSRMRVSESLEKEEIPIEEKRRIKQEKRKARREKFLLQQQEQQKKDSTTTTTENTKM
jgi:hypothetical protein